MIYCSQNELYNYNYEMRMHFRYACICFKLNYHLLLYHYKVQSAHYRPVFLIFQSSENAKKNTVNSISTVHGNALMEFVCKLFDVFFHESAVKRISTGKCSGKKKYPLLWNAINWILEPRTKKLNKLIVWFTLAFNANKFASISLYVARIYFGDTKKPSPCMLKIQLWVNVHCTVYTTFINTCSTS